ncbi:hypothetical protein OHC33_003571 [Knufia fluminis]|uniref:Uncharacterized protein n=1 Tax=Knufia fluminis TaxID=191047 RepID=A0AAN8IPA3_9EURO|nr:hypothetical protein OHC33_003571 [Knufia fluminis]
MATGGLANVLHAVPFRSDWLYYVGLIFFFLNLVLYVVIWSMLLTRFVSYPATFRASLVHPTESLFVPAFVVSLGTICITIVEYGANNAGQWLTKTVLVVFWINVALAMALSITIYMILWSSLTFTIAQMTPIWIFPAYPLLIIGPHAANLSAKLYNPTDALQVIVGGFTVQGIGFLVSLTIYSAFVYRLMTQKLPADPSRPGMFVSVGPAAFTCSGTIGMASNLHRALVRGSDTTTQMFMDVPADLAANILRIVANWCSLWLWGLAIWFFFVSVISNIAPLYTHKRQKVSVEGKSEDGREHTHVVQVQRIPFAMTWYSYIFPQTALTTATFRVAEAFEIHALNFLGCVMTGLLVALWFFVVTMMIRAIMLKHILWPEKGEDREEGGFMRPRTAQGETKNRGDIEVRGAGVPAGTDVERNGPGTRHWPWITEQRA